MSKPNTFSAVVGNIDSQLESKNVGCRFMDRQFELLREADEITLPSPTCSLEACPCIETPIANRIVRHADGRQIFQSNSVFRISHPSYSEVKRRLVTVDISADLDESPFSFQFNQAFEVAIPDHPCKKLKRDVP